MDTTISSLSGATQDQFLQLLIAQVQNQDPFEPVSNTEFVAQLAQFSTLQSTQSLNASFGEMLKLQQLTQGSDLIGKKIQYTPTGSSSVSSGTVNSVNVSNGKILLAVGSDQISLDQLKSVLS